MTTNLTKCILLLKRYTNVQISSYDIYERGGSGEGVLFPHRQPNIGLYLSPLNPFGTFLPRNRLKYTNNEDNEIPKKEIKIRIRWSDYLEIKKLLRNNHVLVFTKDKISEMTSFARESTLKELYRQKKKMKMRVNGKGRYRGK